MWFGYYAWIKSNRPGSKFWHGICKRWLNVNESIIWRVGNGARLNFWKMLLWTISPSLRSSFSVNDESIQKIPPACSIDEKDMVDFFFCMADGHFSNALAYRLLLPINMLKSDSIIPLIWSRKEPERIKLLLWKISCEILMTNGNKKRQNRTDND